MNFLIKQYKNTTNQILINNFFLAETKVFRIVILKNKYKKEKKYYYENKDKKSGLMMQIIVLVKIQTKNNQTPVQST